MTQVTTSGMGILYPNWKGMSPTLGTASAATLDAAAEKLAIMGFCYIDGRPGSAKTISSAGGKIHLRVRTPVTFANAGTTLRVGIQDLSTTAGPAGEPDGTFDVSDDLVGGTDTITGDDILTVTMSTGSKSISHNQEIAIVVDMVSRGGTDSVIFAEIGRSSIPTRPLMRAFTTSWQTPRTAFPLATIEFDDGTLGWIYNSLPPCARTTESYADATNPDERGLILQVPWDCKIEGVYVPNSVASNAADFTINVYATPLGTPSSIASMTVLAEQQGGAASMSDAFYLFSSEVSLTRNTDYWIAVKATGTGNFGLPVMTVDVANHKKLLSGGTNLRKGTRNNSTGEAAETATIIPIMGFIISSFEDTAGAGGATIIARGSNNLLRM